MEEENRLKSFLLKWAERDHCGAGWCAKCGDAELFSALESMASANLQKYYNELKQINHLDFIFNDNAMHVYYFATRVLYSFDDAWNDIVDDMLESSGDTWYFHQRNVHINSIPNNKKSEWIDKMFIEAINIQNIDNVIWLIKNYPEEIDNYPPFIELMYRLTESSDRFGNFLLGL